MAIGNKRWKANLIVILIFVLGFFSGALTANLMSTASEESPPLRRGYRNSERLMEQLAEQLHLSAEQNEAIRQVLAETKQEYGRLRQEIRPRFRQIRTRSRDRIRAVLNPEQKEAFDTLVRSHDERGNRRHGHQ